MSKVTASLAVALLGREVLGGSGPNLGVPAGTQCHQPSVFSSHLLQLAQSIFRVPHKTQAQPSLMCHQGEERGLQVT